MPTYHARIPNSQIQVMVSPGNALPFTFSGHSLNTDDLPEKHRKGVEEYLDAIADVPGSGITKKSLEDTEADVKAIQKQMMDEAALAQTKLVKAGERA